MATYDLSDLYGKNLVLTTTVKGRIHADITSTVKKTYAKGSNLEIFSALTVGNNIFFMIDEPIFGNEYGTLYVKYETGMFNDVSLKDNGVLSLEEKIQAKKDADNANKSFWDILKEDMLGIMSTGKWVIVALIIIFAIIAINKRYPLKQLLPIT